MATTKAVSKKPAASKKEVATPTTSVNIMLDETKQKELSKSVTTYQTESSSIVVNSQETYNDAAALLVKVKQYQTETKSKYFTEPYNAIKVLTSSLDGFWSKLITPAEVIEKSVKGKMEAWVLAEKRRKEEEAREKQRIEDERVEKERKALEKKAATAEKKGNEEKAEEIREQAAAVAPVQVATEKAVSTVGTGTAVRPDFDVEITDIRAFLKFACDDISVDMKELVTVKVAETKKTVKRYQAMNVEKDIPGIKIIERAKISA